MKLNLTTHTKHTLRYLQGKNECACMFLVCMCESGFEWVCVHERVSHTYSNACTHTPITLTHTKWLNISERERESKGEKWEKEILPHSAYVAHTQTNIRQKITQIPTHLFFCVRHSHALSHSLHLWLPYQHHAWWVCLHTPLIHCWLRSEGVSEGRKKKVKNIKNERILSPIPFSLSLSLSYQLLSHALSLSLHFLHFSSLAHSQYTRRPSMTEALTHWKSILDITCIHDETHRKC